MLRAALLTAATGLLLGAAPAHGGIVTWAERDCSRFALTSVPDPCPRVIYVARDDGSERVLLTEGAEPGVPTIGGDTSPSFSPDGRRIAFSRATLLRHLRDHNGMELRGTVLWTMAADGTGQRRLMSAEDLDRVPYQSRPLWTPDGRRLVFEGIPLGGLTGIYSVAADGTDLRRLTPAEDNAHWHSITPDGRVTYTTASFHRPGSQAPHGMETTIWRADVLTGEREQIFFGDIMASFGSVSPDGRWMVMNTTRAGSDRIQTLAMDGSGLVDRLEGNPFPILWAEGSRMLITEPRGDPWRPETLHERLWEMDLDRDTEPRLLYDPLTFGISDWHPGAATAPEEVEDDLPPAVVPYDIPTPSGARARAAAVRKYTRIPLVAGDGTGIAGVEAALARRPSKRGRCRFATPAGRLGAKRSCRRQRYRAIADVAAWRRMTDPLPRGRYELRFRARDVDRNATRRPKVHRLRLRSAPR